jgi:caffeoyl-CoA O-methyltransferase
LFFVSSTHIQATSAIIDYVRASIHAEPDYMIRLRAETALDEWARMQITPEVGALLATLARATGARKVIEIGVFTGYSSISVAHAMPDDGKLVACDVSEKWTAVARRYWAEAGVSHKIDLRLAPAIATLDGLIDGGESGTFDFAFIDADKVNYSAYYDRVFELLRPGGLMAIDNVLWYGRVIDSGINDEDTVALREFNRKLSADTRVQLCMLSVGDGVTVACKRA